MRCGRRLCIRQDRVYYVFLSLESSQSLYLYLCHSLRWLEGFECFSDEILFSPHVHSPSNPTHFQRSLVIRSIKFRATMGQMGPRLPQQPSLFLPCTPGPSLSPCPGAPARSVQGKTLKGTPGLPQTPSSTGEAVWGKTSGQLPAPRSTPCFGNPEAFVCMRD